jgi:hypothetical protein
MPTAAKKSGIAELLLSGERKRIPDQTLAPQRAHKSSLRMKKTEMSEERKQ